MIDPSCELKKHIDTLDAKQPNNQWVGLCCIVCHMDEAVLACWGCDHSDPYDACCFNCATQFELDWDEHGGDTLIATIRNIKES